MPIPRRASAAATVATGGRPATSGCRPRRPRPPRRSRRAGSAAIMTSATSWSPAIRNTVLRSPAGRAGRSSHTSCPTHELATKLHTIARSRRSPEPPGREAEHERRERDGPEVRLEFREREAERRVHLGQQRPARNRKPVTPISGVVRSPLPRQQAADQERSADRAGRRRRPCDVLVALEEQHEPPAPRRWRSATAPPAASTGPPHRPKSFHARWAPTSALLAGCRASSSLRRSWPALRPRTRRRSPRPRTCARSCATSTGATAGARRSR